MKSPNFEKDYNQLLADMDARMNEPQNERYIITDGVMKPDVYFANSIRLAWMLKEPYDDIDGKGGGWSYFDMFKENEIYI